LTTLRARLLTPLVVTAIALAAAAPASAAHDAFRHDLGRVDGHLRIAIEYAPAELGESLRTAEIVCDLAEGATFHGEPELASADWATLGQLVDEAAVAEARRVDFALGNADSALKALRERYERRWSTVPANLRELRRGVGQARRGIAILRAAIAGLPIPFASWHAHECDAARRGVEKTFDRAPKGLAPINVGMLRLWRLALPTEPRSGVP
jgi:hypothetical protein